MADFLDRLKPTYRDFAVFIAGNLFDRFGVNYVMTKYREQKEKELEETSKKAAKYVVEMMKEYNMGREKPDDAKESGFPKLPEG